MIKLFNLDLHISVIKDLQHILNDLYSDKIRITNWSISGHSWVFNENSVCPDFINAYTWRNIDKNTINNFVNKHKNFLESFDGFIVTHTPVFCLIYEMFNKPIIMINSCRYEQPFSWNNNMEMWEYLNEKLKLMYNRKQLIVISNNKGDAEYLKIATDITSYLIPSLCLYTNSIYSPVSNKFLIYNNYNNCENDVIVDKVKEFNGKYSWQQLFSYKGIIHMPYEISTMSLFEQYSANIPLFLPSKKYLYELVQNGNYRFQSRYNKMYGNNYYPINLDLCLNDNTWIDFWINKADFYDESNMKYIIYFDSIEQLKNLVETTDTNIISEKMKKHNETRKTEVYDKWKYIFDSLFNL